MRLYFAVCVDQRFGNFNCEIVGEKWGERGERYVTQYEVTLHAEQTNSFTFSPRRFQPISDGWCYQNNREFNDGEVGGSVVNIWVSERLCEWVGSHF